MGKRIDIRVISGPSAGDLFHFTVEPDKPVTIGRDPGCTMVLQDPMVSRRHAELTGDGNAVFIVDTNSSHGTIHMGFRLAPGTENRHQLKTGDEFKIGDTIFSVRLSGGDEAKKSGEDEKKAKNREVPLLKMPPRRRMIVYSCLLVPLLVVFVLPLQGRKQGLPAQKSSEILSLPEYRLIGYWPGKKDVSANNKDASHLDKAQFYLPAADLVVEYDYISESTVKVYLDDQLVQTLEPSSLAHRVLLIRDVVAGYQRKLIFDNSDYPRPDEGTAQTPRPLKRWAVRSVRAAPLTREVESNLDILLGQAAALALRIDASPDALFSALRSLQKVLIAALGEAAIDAMDYPVQLEPKEADTPVKVDAQTVAAGVDGVIRERGSAGIVPEPLGMVQINTLTNLAAALDAQLWLRVNSGLAEARLAADAKNYIEAYDNLLTVQRMFPGETDLRWLQAQRMIEDKNIVPKKVRANPNKYRAAQRNRRP